MTDTANAPERIWVDVNDLSCFETPPPESMNTDEREYVLSTHCDELVEVARAEGALEAQVEIARLTEALNDIIMCDHHNFYDGPPPRFVQIARAALQENVDDL